MARYDLLLFPIVLLLLFCIISSSFDELAELAVEE